MIQKIIQTDHSKTTIIVRLIVGALAYTVSKYSAHHHYVGCYCHYQS